MPTEKETKSLGLLALAGLQPYEPKADEEYMGEPQMEHFRLLLKAWAQSTFVKKLTVQ